MHVTSLINVGAATALFLATRITAAPTAVPDYNATEVETSLLKRATGPSCDDSNELRTTILNVHNSHRNYHHAPNLEWDSGLASYAQTWVNKCVLQHSGGPYGENLYAIMPGPTDGWTQATTDGLNAWVYEVKNYNYNNPGFAENTGHFTQFVWKSSTKVGCAWNTVDCNGQAIFMCNYNPPGNYAGQYQQNVLPH